MREKEKARLRSPVPWFGGKALMVGNLLPLIPEHEIYVEVFGGGASLLFAKEPSPVEIYNDLDSGLVLFFRCLRDPQKLRKLRRLLMTMPYSREEYCYCRDTWEDCEDEVQRAFRWFVVARMSFSGLFGNSWGATVTKSSRGMAGTSSRWMSAIEELPIIHERVMKTQIENNDFRKIFETYDTEETLFYVDPPYVPETRRGGAYRHELNADDHRELVQILLGLKGMGLLSGYATNLYRPLEDAGWRRFDYQTICHAAGRTRVSGLQGKGHVKEKQSRTESVWVSPRCGKVVEMPDGSRVLASRCGIPKGLFDD